MDFAHAFTQRRLKEEEEQRGSMEEALMQDGQRSSEVSVCCSLGHNGREVTLARGERSAAVFPSIAGRQISLPGDNTHLCVDHMTSAALWEQAERCTQSTFVEI